MHHHGGIYSALATLFNAVRQSGPPPGWNTLTITSIHKRGDKHDPSNYRGIAVMSVLPKLYATLLLQRLEAASEQLQLRAAHQAGFRKGARLEDNILLLQTAIEYSKDRRTPLYLMFVDLRKAYDTIDRQHLWNMMLNESGVDRALLGNLQQLYSTLKASIANHEELGTIPITQGLKQGCPCSPLLFSILFDRVE